MTDAPPSVLCRVDVWLWRARFFKTRSLAGRFVEQGRVRRLRGGAEARIDKPSRSVRPGDGLVFALGGRVIAIEVAAIGERRRPAEEARGLYLQLDDPRSEAEVSWCNQAGGVDSGRLLP